MVPELQTQRLLLKPREVADAKQVQERSPHQETVRHLTKAVPWPYSHLKRDGNGTIETDTLASTQLHAMRHNAALSWSGRQGIPDLWRNK
jgi:hypothetical protein